MNSVHRRLNPSVRGELLVEFFPSYVASGQRNLALTLLRALTRCIPRVSPEADEILPSPCHLAARPLHAASHVRCQWPTESSPCHGRIHPNRGHTALFLCSAAALPPSALAPPSHGISYGPESWPPDNTGTTASPCTGARTRGKPRPNHSTWPASTNAWRRRANRTGPWCCSTPDASGRHPSPSPGSCPDASGRRHLFHPSALPLCLACP